MAAPKNKGPKDPFDDIEDEKVTSKEKEAKEAEDILDSEEEVKEDKESFSAKATEDKEFDDLEEDKPEPIEDEKKADDDTKESEEKEEDQPKHTFIAHKDEDEKSVDPDSKPSFDKTDQSEHTLDDLADEDEKHHGGFGSYAKLGDNKIMDDEEIPHVNPHSSQIPNSGIYASKNNHGGGNKLHLLILVVIGLVVIGVTVYLLKSNFTFPSSIIKSSPAPSSTPITATPEPSPTPPSVDRSKFNIRVLNGTPTSGLAASEAAKLKGLGYKIESTGNATNSAFTKTQVRAKPTLDSLIAQLITDLSSDLKANDTSDAEVILGKN